MQILVVVANIQVRTLKAEVGKGFARTAFDRELVDPEAQINLVNRSIGASVKNLLHFRLSLLCRKGICLNITKLESGYSCGNAIEPGDGVRCPGKSSLFF